MAKSPQVLSDNESLPANKASSMLSRVHNRRESVLLPYTTSKMNHPVVLSKELVE